MPYGRLDPRTTKTFGLLGVYLADVLAELVIDYLAPTMIGCNDDWFIAASGLGELYGRIRDPDAGLAGACAAGNIALIAEMMGHGADAWNAGLTHACLHGRRDAAMLMKKYGACECHRYGCGNLCQTAGQLNPWQPSEIDYVGGLARAQPRYTL